MIALEADIKHGFTSTRRGVRRGGSVLLLASTLLFGGNLWAQDGESKRGIKLRNLVQPHFDEPRFSEPAEDILPNFQVLPEPELSPDESGSIENSATLNVVKVDVRGYTVFTESELETWVSPYEGRTVSVDELQSLRQFLSVQYLQRGYVNSGVIIPEQSVVDGVVVMEAIEGKLTRLALTGNEDLGSRYINHRVGKGVDEPLNVNTLQAALRALQQDRLIRKVDAQLKPMAGLGEAELLLNVSEAPSRELGIEISNHRSTSIGSGVLEFDYADHNLSGHGDRLDVQLAFTEGLDEVAVAYTMPIPDTDLSLSGYYTDSNSEVVEKPFDQLEIESESSSYGFSLAGPLSFADRYPVTMYFGMNHRDSDAFLLGEPFSFSAGAVAGESSSTTVEMGVDFVARTGSQVLALNLSVRQGLDALDATIADLGEVPDGEFTAIYGQAQYARRLDMASSQIIVRGAFQNSLDALLPLEKIAVGGSSTVRGYRENQLVRDNGIVLSAEWRVPLFQSEDTVHNLHGVLFADWGEAWDEDVPSQDDEKIAIGSVGAGVFWEPISNLELEFFWAEALDDDVIENQSGKLQDDGIHIAIRYGVQF